MCIYDYQGCGREGQYRGLDLMNQSLAKRPLSQTASCRWGHVYRSIPLIYKPPDQLNS